ncbi:MAG: YbhB/YbcL family Raf kinase inhibitor-like protein, partial [Candidatus Eremiobacteraeota bacterium]|nr:YbhB/YbcL family Raf kinase inhibitor-like protein [Candidatus Eremiobacteraeota bacterium]
MLVGLVLLGAFAVTCPAANAVTAYPVPLATPIFPADMGTLTVSSTTFSNGGTIPVANVTEGCGGPPGAAQRISPQVSWTAGPPGTGSYAVTMFDTDAPTGTGFWHWIVFNIPPSVTSLPLDAGKNMVPGAIQGYNDGGAAGYRGPCPPV